MARTRMLVGAVAATATMLGMSMATVGGSAGAAPASGESLLAGTASPWTEHARAIGDVAGSDTFSVAVWLKPDIAAAGRFADAVSQPGSPSYRHYLSPDAYTGRFAASRQRANDVAKWLQTQGFTSVAVDSQRAYVSASASTVVVDKAFRVQEKRYRASKTLNAGPYALRSNDRAISLPTSLASGVLGVTGLTNVAPVSTLVHRPLRAVAAASRAKASITANCSKYYGQKRAYNVPEKLGKKTFPLAVCGYGANQLRSAYGANRTNTGKGVRVAVTELGLAPDMYQTLVDYAHHEGMPRPSASRYSELSIGRGSNCGDPFAVEEQLDVEAVYDMAYRSHILVVGGDSCASHFGLYGLFGADEAVLDGNGSHPLVSIDSNSWESGAETQPISWTNIEHAFLLRAAGEGVSMLFSSGDSSGVGAPANDPYATAVGGTTLGIGKHQNRLFETGWSNQTFEQFKGRWAFSFADGAAGGGASLAWAEPSYQRGVVPSRLSKAPGNKGPARAVPDVSADANQYTGMLVGTLYGKKGAYLALPVGGTSVASPLVAGMVAAAEQGQRTPFGFLNPALYKLAGTGAFHDTRPLTNRSRPPFRAVICPARYALLCGGVAFRVPALSVFDVQSKSLTTQVTLKGYDSMTGIGTPNGKLFVAGLRRLAG